MHRKIEFLVFALVGLILAVLPLTGILFFAYQTATQEANSELRHLAERIVFEADRIFADAERSLQRVLAQTKARCGGQAIQAMIVEVYINPHIREMGIYQGGDHLKCTNFGVTDIHISRVNEEATEAGDVTLTVQDTLIMKDRSVILYLDTDHLDGVNTLIAQPVILAKFEAAAVHQPALLEVVLDNGLILSQQGTPVTQVQPVSVRATSQKYPFFSRVTVPEHFLIQRWQKNALIFGPIGLGSSLLLVAMVIWLAKHRFSMKGEIAAGIRNGEFVPYYQPTIDIQNHRIAGCEALVRWRKTNGVITHPDLFMLFAETSGQIFPITRTLMEQIRDDLGPYWEDKTDYRVGINLVADHFVSDDIVHQIQEVFAESTLALSQIAVEITERQPLRDQKIARHVISKLQALGVLVELDDAGTGHGGLAYLQNLNMNVIKIDKMFVDAIATDRPSAPVVDAVINLGHQLNMKIIAEGVETHQQMEYLRDRGVQYVQGYFYTGPLERDAFIAYCERFATQQASTSTLKPVSDSQPEPTCPN